MRARGESAGNVCSLASPTERGGHIPGSASIPWELACHDDGSFKSADELTALYWSRGMTSDKPTIIYSRTGIRSCHTWFVLKYLLGYKDVTNYDGSWTDWSNLLRPNIERKPGDDMVAADIASIDAALMRRLELDCYNGPRERGS